MSNDKKYFPPVSRRFGEYEYVSVWAEGTDTQKIAQAKEFGFVGYATARVTCGGFHTAIMLVAEDMAAALLEAVAYARAVNRERGLE